MAIIIIQVMSNFFGWASLFTLPTPVFYSCSISKFWRNSSSASTTLLYVIKNYLKNWPLKNLLWLQSLLFLITVFYSNSLLWCWNKINCVQDSFLWKVQSSGIPQTFPNCHIRRLQGYRVPSLFTSKKFGQLQKVVICYSQFEELFERK